VFPSVFCSLSPPSYLPWLHGHYPASTLLRRLCHLPGTVLRALPAAMNAVPSRIAIPDSCRSNFQPFYLHPPYAFRFPRSLSRRGSVSLCCRSPFPGSFPFWASPFPSRLANASGRIEFIIFLIMDWLFASGCFPPRLSTTQLPSATDSQCSVRRGLPPRCWCALSGALGTRSCAIRRCASRRYFRFCGAISLSDPGDIGLSYLHWTCKPGSHGSASLHRGKGCSLR
jgi:hypothetical protein